MRYLEDWKDLGFSMETNRDKLHELEKIGRSAENVDVDRDLSLNERSNADSNLRPIFDLLKLRPFLGLSRSWSHYLVLSGTEQEKLDKLREIHPTFWKFSIWADFIFVSLVSAGIIVAVGALVLGAAIKLGFG